MENKTGIFATLEMLGVASLETREIYAQSTRDVDGLTVYRDQMSGVIYIDDFYTGDETYQTGTYRQKTVHAGGTPTYEEFQDAARRSEVCRKFFSGKNILDFGCGKGEFLRAVAHETASCVGIELQQDAVDALNRDGISCKTALSDIEDISMDAVFSFHVIEHLPDPAKVLRELRNKLKEGGTLVIEVPHARDFLLTQVESEPFRNFTLWSQHLVLHTRDSLQRLLKYCGYSNITIEGVQRYPLSNHIQWLATGKPGGHKSKFSSLDTGELTSAYEASLQKIDATDTLLAIARK